VKEVMRYMAPGFFMHIMGEGVRSLFYFLKDDKVVEVKHDEETDEISYVFSKSGKIMKITPQKIEDVEELFPTAWDKFKKILNKIVVAKVYDSKLDKSYVIVVYDNGIVVKMKPEEKV